MIVECKNSDLPQIYDYIGSEYWKCLYLYLNLNKYGVQNDNIFTWQVFQETELQAVMMQYYDCIHLYSRNKDFCLEEVSRHIYDRNCNVIISTGENIRRLLPVFEKKFDAEFLGIFESPLKMEEYRHPIVEVANRDDIKKIAEFMLTDKSYKDIYSYDILYNQLLARFDGGFSRFYIIKDKGKIIASYSTYAETDKLAVLGGLLVDLTYRGQNLSFKLASQISSELIQSGKRVYAFISNEASKKIHYKAGYQQVGELGKLKRRTLAI